MGEGGGGSFENNFVTRQAVKKLFLGMFVQKV